MKLSLKKFRQTALAIARHAEDKVMQHLLERLLSPALLAVNAGRVMLQRSKLMQEKLGNYDLMSAIFSTLTDRTEPVPFESEVSYAKQGYLFSFGKLKESMDDFDQTRNSRFFWLLGGVPGAQPGLFSAIGETFRNQQALEEAIDKSSSSIRRRVKGMNIPGDPS